MRTLQAEWIDYRKRVVPIGASLTQIRETRRSFYAGAHAILTMQWNMSADNTLSDNAAAAIIEGWHQECQQFAAIVGSPQENNLP